MAGTLFIVCNVRLNRWRKKSFVAKWQVSEVLFVVLVSCLLQYPMEVSRSVMRARVFCRDTGWAAHLRACVRRAACFLPPPSRLPSPLGSNSASLPSGSLMGELFNPCGGSSDLLGLCKYVL